VFSKRQYLKEGNGDEHDFYLLLTTLTTTQKASNHVQCMKWYSWNQLKDIRGSFFPTFYNESF